MQVFLDANVFIQKGRQFASDPLLVRLKALVSAKVISVVTTNLTLSEIAKHHCETDLAAMRPVTRKHVRRLIQEHMQTTVPEISADDLSDKIYEKYLKHVSSYHKSLGATLLDVDAIRPSRIMELYRKGYGIFSDGAKKHQFPDAFIYECLKDKASARSPVAIVSNDPDFKAASADDEYIKAVDTLPKLFSELGLDTTGPDVEPFVEKSTSRLVELAQQEVDDWGIQVSDVQDAEVEECVVTDVQLDDLESFGSIEPDGSVLVVGTATVTGDMTYTAPNWSTASYDSEDKILIPWEEESGTRSLSFEIDVSISIKQKNGKLSKIDGFSFVGSNGPEVELEEPIGYR